MKSEEENVEKYNEFLIFDKKKENTQSKPIRSHIVTDDLFLEKTLSGGRGIGMSVFRVNFIDSVNVTALESYFQKFKQQKEVECTT